MMNLRKYIPFYKQNLKVAAPIVLTHLGGAVVSLVDNIMVGRLGATELAAVAFANSIFFIGYVFALGTIMSITPLVGQTYVTGDKNLMSKQLQNGILYSVLIGLAITAIMFVVYLFMHRMGQDAEVLALAKPFYLLIFYSIAPLLFFNLFKQFMEGLGNTKVAMYITIFANLLNVLLNYLLIYGKWGCPQLGVVGAGIATLVSRIVMLLLFVAVFMWAKNWRIYFELFRWKHFEKRIVGELAKVGMPIGGHMLLEVAAFALSSIMVGWLGVVELAANQVVQNVSHMAFMVVVGIASATTIRVSHQYGMRDFYALRMAAKASVHLCLMANFLMAVLMVVGRFAIVNVYTDDAAVIELAASLLLLAALFQLSDGMQAVGGGALRGLTDVRVPVLIAFISYICINLPLGYVLAFKMGLGAHGVWIGFVVGLSIAAILLLARYVRRIRQLQRAHEKGPEQ